MGDELSKEEKKNFYERFTSIEKSLDRILGILEIDQKLGEKGLVITVKEIQKTLQELLIRELVYKAKATTWGIIGGSIVTAIVYFVKFAFAKLMIIG
jgi:hypothetical protein